MSATEIELRTPTLTLAARRWHAGAPTRVLALHGWLDNAASFDALAPLLPDCDIVALDLPGHGRSAHRAPGAWYHFMDYGSDVLAAADALGWERFTVLGHSLGGAIASVFAAGAPERVEALWLIEALGPISTPAARVVDNLRQALRDRVNLAGKSLRVFATREQAMSARRQAGELSEVAARRLIDRGTREVDGGFVWSSDPRLTLTSMIRLTEDQVSAYLAGIECPTLVIAADPAPPWISSEAMAKRCAQVRDARLVILPGTHHLHLEDPEPVARAIAHFRARLAAA